MRIHSRITAGIMMTGLLVALGGSVYAMGSKPQECPKSKECAAAKKCKKGKPKSCFACPSCNTVARKAGKCEKCKKDMQKMHVLGKKGGKAMLCSCPANCKCDAKGVKEGKCACGKEVATIECKGKCSGAKCGSKASEKKAGACGCDKKTNKTE